MHGLVAVDVSLNPLTNLITWRDRRTAGAADDLCRHAYAAETGCFLHPGYGGLTLHHLMKNGGLPGNTYKILTVPGYIAAKWTGRCVIDETLAASWGIWNVRENRWHEPLLRVLGIPVEILPEFVAGGAPIGTTPEGITVCNPIGDNQAGVLGALDGDSSAAVVNIGTSSQFSVPLTEFAFDQRLETRPLPGGGFIQTYAALCGGWAYAYLNRFFREVIEQVGGVRMEPAAVYDVMERLAADLDSGGLRADTRFAGVRNGSPPSGAITGILTDNFTPGHLVRAFAMGIADELAEASAFARMDRVEALRVVGNGARRNPPLLRALETRFGFPCRMAEIAEEAAYGAVRAAFVRSTLEESNE
jgi:sedoheptulokinase